MYTSMHIASSLSEVWISRHSNSVLGNIVWLWESSILFRRPSSLRFFVLKNNVVLALGLTGFLFPFPPPMKKNPCRNGQALLHLSFLSMKRSVILVFSPLDFFLIHRYLRNLHLLPSEILSMKRTSYRWASGAWVGRLCGLFWLCEYLLQSACQLTWADNNEYEETSKLKGLPLLLRMSPTERWWVLSWKHSLDFLRVRCYLWGSLISEIWLRDLKCCQRLRQSVSTQILSLIWFSFRIHISILLPTVFSCEYLHHRHYTFDLLVRSGCWRDSGCLGLYGVYLWYYISVNSCQICRFALWVVDLPIFARQKHLNRNFPGEFEIFGWILQESNFLKQKFLQAADDLLANALFKRITINWILDPAQYRVVSPDTCYLLDSVKFREIEFEIKLLLQQIFVGITLWVQSSSEGHRQLVGESVIQDTLNPPCEWESLSKVPEFQRFAD